MASRATWAYRGDPDQGQEALLVQFSNGNIQSPDSLDFTLYRNKDHKTPKTKKQRILAAETDRLSYVGNNFSSDASKCNTLCRYFVGILNKESGTMEVYDAEHFKMQPILGSSTNSEVQNEDGTDQPSKSYREKMDSLIEAFGTNKQKRALSSRKLNQVGSEILSKAMEKAAEEIIESRGTTELVKDAVGNKEQDSSLFLPPCDFSAEKPEDVYKFDDLLFPAEYAALEVASAAFRNITSEELQQMVENKKYGLFVLQELHDMPKDEKDRDHKARCLWYLDALIKLSQQKVVKRKEILSPECPNIICGKLMKNFTVVIYKNGSILNSISGTTKSKIVAHVIALALHITDFQVDLTFLQRDMKLKESRILEIARAMGLKINKKMMFMGASIDEGHKIGVLTIPLTVYKPPVGGIKRKKM
ncbi:DNA-directed RNA polymerase I subunit RPA49 [Ascaphus truei]|uniref:DNA-directed RNA polymerase I subunit RPA49 n=1 Tax=Ascaphus truei TaxID=8439 RepID=UPI003F59EFD4